MVTAGRQGSWTSVLPLEKKNRGRGRWSYLLAHDSTDGSHLEWRAAIEFKIASIRFDEKDEFLNDTVSKKVLKEFQF